MGETPMLQKKQGCMIVIPNVPPVENKSDHNHSTCVPPVEKPHGRDAHATDKGRFHLRWGAKLPHWRQEGAIYAVTFRLADSVPKQVLKGWQQEREKLIQAAIKKEGQFSPAESDRLEVLFSDKVEQYLNNRNGACWMIRDDVAELVQNALLYFDGTRYDLFAWCVMPNHVHVVVRPSPTHSLESILHSWKSFTSKKIGELVDKTGPLWQSEYYDHLIRDEEDLIHAIEYVLNNPTVAGLNNWRWVSCTCFPPLENTSEVNQNRSTGVPPVEKAHGRDAQATEETRSHECDAERPPVENKSDQNRSTGVPPVE
ncbi:MAG: transposase [Zavarzinella sp.]